MKLKNQILAIIAILASTSAVKAQIIVTSTNDAPIIGDSDVSFLPGDISNAGAIAGGDNWNYVADNRPSKGETFTTGANDGGYAFNSLTVQMATPSYSPVYYVFNTNVPALELQIGTVDGTLANGTTLTPLYTATNVLYFGTNTSDQSGTASGPGTYLTYDLSGANLTLSPNTQYYFELTTTQGQGGVYYPLNSSSSGYTGGQVFITGGTPLSTTVNSVAADGSGYAFDASLVAVPEPGTYALIMMGLLGVVVMIRRRLAA